MIIVGGYEPFKNQLNKFQWDNSMITEPSKSRVGPCEGVFQRKSNVVG